MASASSGGSRLAVEANWLRTVGAGSVRANSSSFASVSGDTFFISPSSRTAHMRIGA